uniref:Uncharacterized protein n=1 Tax=Timema shepardi TaxID=629360 RepID=A0A7R9B8T1_TIMSH|nr:unnamed protein product [Timema shepardi]
MVGLFDQLHNTPNTTGPTHPNVNNLSDWVPKARHQETLASDIQGKVILLTRSAVWINVKPYGRKCAETVISTTTSIERATTGLCPYTSVNVSSETTEYNVTGLEACTQYFILVTTPRPDGLPSSGSFLDSRTSVNGLYD